MSEPRAVSRLLPIIATLSAAGAAISIWQTRLFYITRSGMSELHSFCNIGQTFDCTAIEISKYSELPGGFPLSALGIAGYLIILTLAFFAMSDTFRTHSRKLLIAFTGLALLFSAAYLFIMIAIIGKLCLLCLCIDAINLSLFILALQLPKNDPLSESAFRPGPLAGAMLASVLIAFLFAKGLDPQAEVKKEDMNDLIESVMNSPVVPIQIPADAPFIGDPNAKVTIVKLSDYECPACKMGASAIHPLFKRYKNGVKFVFINYPLDQGCNPNVPRKMHEFACEAALVAICGANQGKFLETYEALFDHQVDFVTGKIADILARVPGMDMAKLKECTQLPSTTEKLKRDIELGGKGKLDIQSTPTFYINGKKVEGGLPTNLWVEIIDRMLKQ